jgi:hypothetical protein
MPAGAQPSASVAVDKVTVTWPAASFAGGAAVGGYVVKRYSTGGVVQTVGAGCSGTISALTCTETSVPAGSWRYSVTPKQGAWAGAESTQSSTVTVAAASLSLSGTTVTALPTTLGGSIAGFAAGQTVTFRLDNPTTGTALTGSINPTPVPASGGSSVSVTIPAGTSNGAHTVYAIGSGGTIASAAITVAVPTFVRNVGSATCGATSLIVTVPAAGVAAGDTLVLRLALGGVTSGTIAASDTKGNAYTVDRDVLNVNQRAVILRARATTALVSGDKVTVTFPTATASSVFVDELSGIAANALDVSASGTGTSTAPTASVTPTVARDLVVGAVSVGASATANQPGGWTALGGGTATCTSTLANLGGRRVASNTSALAYNPTLSVSARWAEALVAYRAG